MQLITQIISSLIGAVFFYYMITIIFTQRNHGKIAVPIYLLYTIFQGYQLYQIGLIYLIAIIPYVFFLVMLLNYYEIGFKKGMGSKKFLKKSNTERKVISLKISRKIQMITGIILIQLLFVGLLTLTLKEVFKIEYYYLILLELLSLVFIYRYLSVKKEYVILVIGDKDRKIYETTLKKLSTPLNNLSTDENYIIDQAGIVILENGFYKNYYHILTLLIDQKDYVVPQVFKPSKDPLLEQIKYEFRRYEYKKQTFVQEESKYQEK